MNTRRSSIVKLGSRISGMRKAKGVTLESLAESMSISKGNLSDIERGKKDPRYSTLHAIASGLGVPLARLLKDL